MQPSGGYQAEVWRAETDLLSSQDTHELIAGRLGISPGVVRSYCNHLVQRAILDRCTHVQRGNAKTEVLPSLGQYGQQAQPPSGHPPFGAPPYGDRPSGRRSYPPGQQWYGEQDPGQYPGHPQYGRYGQQPRQPSFIPNTQYGPPRGQPPHQGQSYGPPGQQPYPYPGNSGPQPPRRRRKRHLVRNIFAGIGAMVVAGIAIAALRSHSTGVSTTPPGNSGTSSTTAKVAGVGSSFDLQDENGDTYRVTLVKVIDPARGADQFNTPDNGKRFIGAVFTIKALSGSPQSEDANDDAAVVGSNGQTYNADLDNIAGYTNFSNGQINIAQGDTTTGAVVFQVPDRIKVTEVQWSASAGFGSTVQWDGGG